MNKSQKFSPSLTTHKMCTVRTGVERAEEVANMELGKREWEKETRSLDFSKVKTHKMLSYFCNISSVDWSQCVPAS